MQKECQICGETRLTDASLSSCYAKYKFHNALEVVIRNNPIKKEPLKETFSEFGQFAFRAFFAPSSCLFLAYIIMYVPRKGKKMGQKMHQKSNHPNSENASYATAYSKKNLFKNSKKMFNKPVKIELIYCILS